ncbi:MAG: glycosyltransferase [Chitinophagales bacterium]|nr:glycosyltransferase [Chitinophagales bacterium]
MEVSVFMPIYNAAAFIEENIYATASYLEKSFDDYELIAVDDNSKDQSLTILLEVQKKLPKLRVVRNKIGPSKRENLGKAMLEAKFDFVLFQDQDLAVPLNYIAPAINYLNSQNFDLVIGNRYSNKSSKRSIHRLILSKGINLLIHLLFRIHIRDIFCGFKAYKKDKLHQILAEMSYDEEFKRGWFWDAEFLIRARKHQFKIHELSVSWTENQVSNINLIQEINLIVYLSLFFFRKKF